MSPEAAASRECTGSFSLLEQHKTPREVEEEFLQHPQQQRQYHIKPLLGGLTMEILGSDDGDLHRVTTGAPSVSEPPTAPPPAVKKKRSLPGTPGSSFVHTDSLVVIPSHPIIVYIATCRYAWRDYYTSRSNLNNRI